MSQLFTALPLGFLLIFVALLIYFTFRVRTTPPILRHIPAFEKLPGLTSRAIETGRSLHLSLGIGGVANETTADTLAGLTVLSYLARQAAQTGASPVVSMANPMVMLYAQNVVREAYTEDKEGVEQAYHQIRWMAPQPAAYAAGVINLMNIDQPAANVLIGNFGDEYLLMGETAVRGGSKHIGGASNPNTLPFIYTSAEDTLLGEEIYAAGAYLEQRPAHLGSLIAQDGMRFLIALAIFIGILTVSLR